MAEVVGVRFKEVGKIYYFDPTGLKINKEDHVIVETVRGVECGQVAIENRELPDDEIIKPLKPIIRVATDDDLKKLAKNKEKEKEAFDICLKKIENHKLAMKLISVEYTFDSSKIIFYFTADTRIDFRELVKDLACSFRARIELRQIGIRDESKMKGGLGVCGRPFCCNSFMGDFHPVTIKMAKDQGLSLNPVKISGTCSRLMCCLKYEQENYEHLLRVTPKIGAVVDTNQGRGVVVEADMLRGRLKIKLDNKPSGIPVEYDRHDVKLIKDKKITVDKKEMDALKGIE